MKKLQVFRDGKWQWVFCWSLTESKVITTQRVMAAIDDVGSNLVYFQDKTSCEIRSIRPSEAAHMAA